MARTRRALRCDRARPSGLRPFGHTAVARQRSAISLTSTARSSKRSACTTSSSPATGSAAGSRCELALRDPRDLHALVLVDAAGLRLMRGRRRHVHVLARRAAPRIVSSTARARRRSATRKRAEGRADDGARRVVAALLQSAAGEVAAPAARADADRVGRRRRSIFPPRQADAFADAIPGAQVLVIPDAGHLPHVEQPEAFAARPSPRSSRESGREVHRVSPDAVCRPRSVVHRALRLGVGDAAQQLLRSGQGPRALQPLPRRTRVCRPARLRRHRRQRASPERLRPDADARRHRGRAGAAHARQDRGARPRAAAGQQPARRSPKSSR